MTRIAIVGAGIAGLCAARVLQDAGLACDLYEASSRIGGRMHSDAVSWHADTVSEWCGEFIDEDHQTIHDLIRRFGLDTIDLGQGKTQQAQTTFYFSQRYCSAEELYQNIQALLSVVQAQAQAAGFPTTYDHFTPEGQRLDHLSVAEWIQQYVEGGSASPVGKILSTACSGIYGLDPDEQSALNLVYQFGLQEATNSLILGGPTQGRKRIRGGNQQLPLAIARSLPEGSLHLEHQLTAIEQMSDGTQTLTFAVAGNRIEVQCDHVILTLPFSVLRHIDYQRAGFDALKQTAIEELGYGTVSKLFLEFDQRYWLEEGPWPHPANGSIITDLDIQSLWETSRVESGPYSLLVDYTSGHRGAAYAPANAYTPPADAALLQGYARNCLQQLELVMPGISAHYTGRVALSYPTGDPFLRGCYSCWRVGQYTRFGGYEKQRQGMIHFAGEHCSVDFQGYMEGAAREGMRAAREILQDLSTQKD